MAKRNLYADTGYEIYKDIKNKIKELENERDKVCKEWERTMDSKCWTQWENLTAKIHEKKAELYSYAKIIVESIYESEEK